MDESIERLRREKAIYETKLKAQEEEKRRDDLRISDEGKDAGIKWAKGAKYETLSRVVQKINSPALARGGMFSSLNDAELNIYYSKVMMNKPSSWIDGWKAGVLEVWNEVEA